MTTEPVLDIDHTADGRVLVLTMNRAAQMNALNAELIFAATPSMLSGIAADSGSTDESGVGDN